jgi:hypothetical protein
VNGQRAAIYGIERPRARRGEVWQPYTQVIPDERRERPS